MIQVQLMTINSSQLVINWQNNKNSTMIKNHSFSSLDTKSHFQHPNLKSREITFFCFFNYSLKKGESPSIKNHHRSSVNISSSQKETPNLICTLFVENTYACSYLPRQKWARNWLSSKKIKEEAKQFLTFRFRSFSKKENKQNFFKNRLHTNNLPHWIVTCAFSRRYSGSGSPTWYEEHRLHVAQRTH